MYTCNFEQVANFELHEGYFFEVRELRFTLSEPVSIQFREHTVIKADASEKDWKLARLHLQVQLQLIPRKNGH